MSNRTDPMPFRFTASLLSLFMANDAYDGMDAPAPLPRHEREWRHPSERAADVRRGSRIAAPRLSSFVSVMAVATAVALFVGLCLLIVPRNARRESLPTFRNATLSQNAKTTAVADIPPGLRLSVGSMADGRVLVPADAVSPSATALNPSGSLFLSISRSTDAAFTDGEYADGRRIAMRTLHSDPVIGLGLYAASAPMTSATLPITLSTSTPTIGTNVVIVDTKSTRLSAVRLKVGVAVTVDENVFVPLSNLTGTIADTEASAISDGSPVFDVRNRLVGMFARRGVAIGFVPVATISRFVDAAVTSRHG